MGSAKVVESIIDLSTRVDSNVATAAVICLPDAPKGPVGVPYLVTSIDDLLNYYTSEGTIKPTYNLAFFEAEQYLARANKLFCIRPDSGQLFGGSRVVQQIEAVKFEVSTTIEAGSFVKPVGCDQVRVNKFEYQIGDIVTIVGNEELKFECTGAGTTSEELPEEFSTIKLGETVTDGSVVFTAIAMNNPKDLVFKCTKAGTTAATEPAWPTADGEEVVSGEAKFVAVKFSEVGALEAGEKDPVLEHEFNSNEAILIYGKFPGSDNNNIGYKIFNYETYPDKVGEPGAFLIEVYYRGTSAPLESFVCSRNQSAKDGYGQNIYVENAVAGSMYINALDNIEIEPEVNPVDVTTVQYLAGGDDGDACTDGMMVKAIDKIKSKASYPIKFLMDGGWTTVVYQKALNAIAEERKDCIAILSTPYSVENAATYMTDIVTYRDQTLNLNSYWSAIYTPHVQVYDSYNDRYLWISPGSQATGKLAEISVKFQPWYPAAGLNRGVLNNVTDLKRVFDEGQMDTLVDKQINPITKFQGEGIVIWGQKTLYSRPSALQELNVMMLMVTVLPAVAKTLKYYLFEFNDDDTQAMIKAVVDSYMETIKANKGVHDFITNVHASDNDKDNGICYVDLIVKPNLAINEIRFRIMPTRSGQDLSAIVSMFE